MNDNNVLLIKDLSRITGLSSYTVKYYLKLGLIKEMGRTPETNFRIFDARTVERLQQIRSWRKTGVSIKEIANRVR